MPYGINWILFIGIIILAILGIGFLSFVLIVSFLFLITDRNWVMLLLLIGCILFFSGLFYQIYKDNTEVK